MSPPATAPAESLRERNKREKRARITAAARDLFSRKGFEATTAREICQRAGIGTGTLFLYVRDKRELLFLVFRDEARARFRTGLDKAKGARDLVDALMCLFGEFIAFYAEHPALAAPVFEELFLRARGPDGVGALTVEYLECVQRILAHPRFRGVVRADVTLREQSMAFFAQYGFWVQAWLSAGVSRAQAEAGLRRALALQLEGLSGVAMRGTQP